MKNWVLVALLLFACRADVSRSERQNERIIERLEECLEAADEMEKDSWDCLEVYRNKNKEIAFLGIVIRNLEAENADLLAQVEVLSGFEDFTMVCRNEKTLCVPDLRLDHILEHAELGECVDED